jgi:polyphosphate glucokinase
VSVAKKGKKKSRARESGELADAPSGNLDETSEHAGETSFDQYDEAARDPGPRTLSIDIGGTGIKAAVLNSKGDRVADRIRVRTPHPARPETVLDALSGLAESLPHFDRVSVGFPGVVRDGRTFSAPNLDSEFWGDFDLTGAVGARLGRPVRALNDAEIHGLGVIEGRGTEMIVTLGTGFGCGIYQDGRVAPHLELGHHPFRQGETYEEQLSDDTLKRLGKRKWNRRLERAIESLRKLVNFDRLYIGGGNAKRIDFDPGPDVTIVSNDQGIRGGIALWRDEDEGRRAWLEAGGSPEVL